MGTWHGKRNATNGMLDVLPTKRRHKTMTQIQLDLNETENYIVEVATAYHQIKKKSDTIKMMIKYYKDRFKP